jgi:hypothetical protein
MKNLYCITKIIPSLHVELLRDLGTVPDNRRLYFPASFIPTMEVIATNCEGLEEKIEDLKYPHKMDNEELHIYTDENRYPELMDLLEEMGFESIFDEK